MQKPACMRNTKMAASSKREGGGTRVSASARQAAGHEWRRAGAGRTAAAQVRTAHDDEKGVDVDRRALKGGVERLLELHGCSIFGHGDKLLLLRGVTGRSGRRVERELVVVAQPEECLP
jgi:hypothetical protein